MTHFTFTTAAGDRVSLPRNVVGVMESEGLVYIANVVLDTQPAEVSYSFDHIVTALNANVSL